MELKKGDKTVAIPGWVIAAGIVTIGTIVSDICKTLVAKKKQVPKQQRVLTDIWLRLSFIFENFPGVGFFNKLLNMQGEVNE